MAKLCIAAPPMAIKCIFSMKPILRKALSVETKTKNGTLNIEYIQFLCLQRSYFYCTFARFLYVSFVYYQQSKTIFTIKKTCDTFHEDISIFNQNPAFMLFAVG
jgi:hypothetical protein